MANAFDIAEETNQQVDEFTQRPQQRGNPFDIAEAVNTGRGITKASPFDTAQKTRAIDSGNPFDIAESARPEETSENWWKQNVVTPWVQSGEREANEFEMFSSFVGEKGTVGGFTDLLSGNYQFDEERYNKAKQNTLASETRMAESAPERNWFEEIISATSGSVRRMGAGYVEGKEEALAGAGVGAGIGALTGRPGGVKLGIQKGAQYGLTTGSAKYWAKSGFGEIASTLAQQDVDHEIIAKVAPIGGIAYAAAEYMVSEIPGFPAFLKSNPVISTAMKKTAVNMAKEYGKRVVVESTEESVQQFITDLSNNIAAEMQNSKIGSKIIEKIPIEEMLQRAGSSFVASLGPSALMMGPSAIQSGFQSKKISKSMNKAGLEEGSTLTFEKKEKGRGKEAVIRGADGEVIYRGADALTKVSDTAKAEDEATQPPEVPATAIDEVEQEQMKEDIRKLSAENEFIPTPEQIDQKISNEDLLELQAELEKIYGYIPEAKQIRDLFSDPMQKKAIEVEEEQKELKPVEISELKQKVKARAKGEISRQEFVEYLNEVSPEMAKEFTDRTTGENPELAREVLKEILAKEAQDGDTKRKQTDGTEQQEVTGQQPVAETATDQADGQEQLRAAEEGEVAPEKTSDVPRVQTDTEVAQPATPAEPEVAKPIKEVFPPNPQLPINQWLSEMRKFAVKAVQTKITKAQFVSDLESDYLHYEATSEDLAKIYDDAKIEAKRVADAQKAVPQLKAKPKKDIEGEKQRVSVDPAKMVSEIFRQMEKASQSGKRAGIKAIKQQIRDFKGDATALVKELRTQMEGLKKSSKLERSNLSNAIKDIQLAKTPEAQEKAFNKSIDLLEETYAAIDKRTPKFEYVPFDTPDNEYGVDKNSSYKDVRKAYVENGGLLHDKRVGRNRATVPQMLRYFEGTTTAEADVHTQGAVEGLEEQVSRARKDRLLKGYNKTSNALSWLHNLDDMMSKISIFEKGGRIRKLSGNLSAGRQLEGKTNDNLKTIADNLGIAEDFDSIIHKPTVLSGAKRVATGTRLTRKYKISIGGKNLTLSGGEIFNVYLQLKAKDNRQALEKNGKIILRGSGKFLRFGDVAKLETAINEAIESEGLTDQFDGMVEKWQSITDATGKLNKERYDAIQKKRGSDETLELVDGVYMPIATAGNDMNMDDNLEEIGPDGTAVNTNNSVFNMIHRSHLQKRIGRGSGYVVVGDALQTIDKMIRETSEFYGAGEAIMDISKMLNNKTLSDSIMDVYGKDFVDNLNAKIHQLQGTERFKDKSTVGKWVDKPLKGLVRKATQLRLIAVTTQMKMRGSMYLAMNSLENPKASLAFAELNLGNKFLRGKAIMNGLLKTRWKTEMFSPELMFGQNSKSILNDLKGNKTKYEKFRAWSKSWGDKSAIMGIYRMVAYDSMIEQGLGKTMADMKKLDQQFFDDVGNKTAQIVGTSQPSGYAEHLSVLKSVGRHNTAAMLFTLYGSQASRLAGNMDMATSEYLNKRDSKSMKKLGRTAMYFGLVNSIYMSLVMFGGRLSKDLSKALWGKLTGNDDDDEKLVDNITEDLKNIPKDALLNIAKMSEVTDEIVEVISGLVAPRYGKEQPLDAFAGRELQAIWDMGAESVKLAKLIKDYENNVYETTVDGEKVKKRIKTRKMRDVQLNNINKKIKKVTDSAIYGVGFLRDIPTRYLEPLELGDLAGKAITKNL